ncbi:snRNA-activating protein complex subunit 2-like isoform X2 [Pyxicephalus adspersus]|uniref:snRNA-activating protein complex subunit 2-like isoform X2 n=1 Tax=Pyxicephalus adspersus TaxID=30357 RepID=UPI003B5B682E
MKPPSRRRSAPVRFEGADAAPARTAPIRLAWLGKEKMELLRGLKAQVNQKVPNPPVQGRSKSQVASYIAWLRSRAAREAVQTVYKNWVKERKAQEAEPPAPIELWTDLVSRMSGPAEKAMAAAFSQMLTIASTEPVTLQHSIPSRLPRKSSASRSKSLVKKSSKQEEPSREGPALAEEGPAPVGEGPAPAEEGPAPAGEGPSPAGEGPAAAAEGPAATAEGPAAAEEGPAATAEGPAAAEEGPAPKAEGPAAAEEGPAPAGEGSAPAVEGPGTAGDGPVPALEGPTSAGEEPAAADSRWKNLNFEKIYKYLSKAATGEALPKLSECESAVVLHLLHCIPGQLQTLDYQALNVFLRNAYTRLNAAPKTEETQKETPSNPEPADWKELGFSPLNPFQLPVELLKPKNKTF